MVPVVGSVKAARLSERLGASAVVVESVEAGGHLGTDQVLDELLPPILEAVDIPVIGAGNIVTGADIAHVLSHGRRGRPDGHPVRGHRGVQRRRLRSSSVTSRPPRRTSSSSEAPSDCRAAPCARPSSRSSRRAARRASRTCRVCLKKCGKDFCIVSRLEEAQRGDIEHGLVFAGSSVTRVHDIPTGADLMERLQREYDEATQTTTRGNAA